MQIIESKENFKNIVNLIEKSFNNSMEPNDPDFQNLNEWLDISELENNPEIKILQALENDQSVGVIAFSKGNLLFWPDGKKAELLVLAVDPDVQGKGIGKDLINEALDKCKMMGAKSIIFNAHSSLEKLHNYYVRLGFEIIGELEGYFDNGNATFFKINL